MATLAEIRQLCDELNIEYDEKKSRDELLSEIRKAIDLMVRKGSGKMMRIGFDKVSPLLKRFMVEEYDYVVVDRDGNLYDWKGRKKENIGKSVR